MCIPKTSNEGTKLTKRFEAIPDKLKTQRASMPNLIHHLDAWVLQVLIEGFRLTNKPLFTVHDAFYCRLTDVNFLKQTYYNALQEIYKTNPWENLLLNNKITTEDIIEPTKEEIHKIKTFNDTLDSFVTKLPPKIKFKPMSPGILH
uniref:RNA polymerase n=1 Tax=Hedophyllum nigripes TaxID=2724434 RepID=A0A8F0FBU7_9PHAE|nr:RNA polymerase [Hedophyllum nigripes]